tara:strand:- start:231 stop:965 length:735 start_codon:yes stop_codon:yes gene_type:complete
MRKLILIFGGTSDIGFSIAKEFAINNFDVILIGRNEEKLKLNQSILRSLGKGNSRIMLHDFSEINNIKYDFDDLVSTSDISVVCYGEMSTQDNLENTEHAILHSVNINFLSQIILINKINKIYKNIGHKSILVVSSVAGDRGKASNYIYGSSKAGLSEYLSGLRQSNAKKKVHICTLKPGFVFTKMTKHLSLPPLLTSTADKVGRMAYKAYLSKSDIVYISAIWKYIMLVIKCIPEFIFKRIRL